MQKIKLEFREGGTNIMAEGKTTKLVDFQKYCHTCTHWETFETDEPCNSCLIQQVNENSEKPVNYIPKKGEKK